MKFQKVRKSVALILAVLTLAGGTVAALPSITTESLAAYGMEMPALENNSTISSTSTNQGVAVTLYANAAGGTGTYSYGFFYKKKTSSAWSTIQDYSSVATAKLTPAAAVDYDVCIKIKDENGTLAKKYFTLNVAKSTLKCTGKISSQNITRGQSITLTGSAEGGAGGYTYGYFYKKSTSSTWATLKNYSTDTTAVLTPATTASYDVCIKVKDSGGVIARKNFTVKVGKSISISASCSPSEKTTKKKGVTLSAKSVNEKDSYSYAFYYKKSSSSSWNLARDYGSFVKSDSYSIYPASLGKYDFRIRAKDSNGAVTNRIFTVNVVNEEPLVNNSYIDNDTITLGDTTVVYAEAAGGSGADTYSYKYEVISTETQETIFSEDYSSIESYEFEPPYAGSFVIKVSIKDGSGNIAEKEFNITVTEPESLDIPTQIVKEIITDEMSDFKKALTIHNWIIDNTVYDYENYESGTIPYSSYEAEGVFEHGVAVCDGYSKAFLILAEKAGLEAIRVTGIGATSSGTEGHAWNQVRIDGDWYNVDVTWDDPIVSDDYEGDNLRYTYFLVPDSSFTDHAAESSCNKCTKPQPMDEISNYAIECELANDDLCAYAESIDDMKEIMQNFYDSNITSFRIIYKTDETNSSKIFNDAFSAIPSGCGARAGLISWKLPGYWEVSMVLS